MSVPARRLLSLTRWCWLTIALLTLSLDAATPGLIGVSIDGPGRGQLVQQPHGFELRLTGTSALSVVSIVNSGDTHVPLVNITTNSAVGTLDLGNADLSGKITFKFPVGRLTLGQVGPAAILLSGSNAFSFSAGAVGDAVVVAPNASVNVNVDSWTSGRLEAARLSGLLTAGDFGADLFLTNTGAGFTLDSVRINGTITGGVWSVQGHAEGISAGSTAATWRANIGGPLLSFSTSGDASGQLAAAEIELLQLGSARGLRVLVGADLGDDAALGGIDAAADSFSPGTLARVHIDGDMIDSNFYSSVDPVNGVLNDGDDVQLGTAAQRLQEFLLGGQFVGASSVVAPAFPTSVSVGGVSLDPATLPEIFRNLPGGGDHTPPVLTSFQLATASDTDPVGDNRTIANPVTLVGVTEAGATLTLRLGGSVLGTMIAAPDGSFSFTNIALALGENALELSVADAAGNITTGNLLVTRDPDTTEDDTTAPTIDATLLNDTGLSAHDGVTRDPTITGSAIDNVGVTQLRAALDPGAQPTFTDISAQLQPNGSFTLSHSLLDTLAGGHLAEAQHTLRLLAADAAGNVSTTFELAFTLDTVAPTGASFGISLVDALNGDVTQTTSAIVTLQGVAEAAATITLTEQNLLSTSGAGGNFQLPGVALTLGATPVTLEVSDTAGNSQSVTRTLTRVQAQRNDAVLAWIDTALHAIQADVTHPQIATRTLAIQSLAVYDTLAAIQGTPAYLVQRTVTGSVNAEAAATQAAYRVLHTYYPGQRATFDAARSARLATIPESAAKTAGITLGNDIANAVIDIRSSDGYLNFVSYDGSTGLGEWRPTEPLFLVAEEPHWGQVTPFALEASNQFRAPAPPRLDSPEYAVANNQVQSLGRFDSTTRTADQTQQAQFWADGAGSFTPPGHWNQIAAEVAAARGNSLSANARLMAQLNVALADAAIAAWDTKYSYTFWRPVTAIHNADQDNNPATTADANWTPLLITPAHPSYVSGHCTFSAAAAGVLNAVFGADTSFTTTSSTLLNVTRSYTSFDSAADEAGMSRIYGGIHTSLDNAAGKVIGTQVAQTVLARFAQTQDSQPPQVVLNDTPNASRTNVTVTGQVLDNLSGVASAQLRVDDADPHSLTLDATGHFSFNTTFATNGATDGAHTLAISARDLAGNVSAEVVRVVTVDTQAPNITLTSIASGDVLTVASRLTGSIDATGSAVTQLFYRFDDGATRNLPFDAVNSRFDDKVVISTLTEGTHTLTITARDSADNVSTLTRNVLINALPPFTLSSVTPAAGSNQVGVTQRPQILFSRPVNAASLTANSLFASGPDGTKLAASIVPASDGSFAWLFFDAPMPGGAQITVHVDGGLIRAAVDGAFLDADNNGEPGGVQRVSFTTVSSTPVTGTRIVGRVFDPGPDLKPMTFDDIRRGPDGVIHTPDDVFLLPIAHAKVFILGHEERFVFTDANGRFELNGVPAGDVKVAIDGRTATNTPAGLFFPEMVMDTLVQAGVVNTLMGGMGSLEQRLLNADRDEVYLPRVPSSVLQSVSDTEATVIAVDDPKAASQLTDQQREALKLTVNPGSAVGLDGSVMTNAQLGISTVPPELVKDMLPPGVLQHTFDITIQAPNVATFTQPVQISFPNVFNALPGTQLNVLSFDHTTGLLVINGTATVAADGLSVVSDPDSGIRAPGWHGLTPPGGCGGSGGEPPAPLEDAQDGFARAPGIAQAAPPTNHPAVTLGIAFGDRGVNDANNNNTLTVTRQEWSWTAPPAPPGGGSGSGGGSGGGNPCAPTHPAPPAPGTPPAANPLITVTIDVDGPLDVFAKQLPNDPNAVTPTSQTFTLAAGSGTTKKFGFQMRSYDEFIRAPAFHQLTEDQLYGAKITVTRTEQKADGTSTQDVRTYYQYRWVDVIDPEQARIKRGNTAQFLKTLADGTGGLIRTKFVDCHLPATVETDFSVSAGSPFTVAGRVKGNVKASWKFDPPNETPAAFARALSVVVVDATLPVEPNSGLGLIGSFGTFGAGKAKKIVGLNIEAYKNEFIRVMESLATVYTRGPNGTLIDPKIEYLYFARLQAAVEQVQHPTNHKTVFVQKATGVSGADFVEVSPWVQEQYADFMPAKRGPGPDGVPGTVDDAPFTPAQRAALLAKLNLDVPPLLVQGIRNNYQPVVGNFDAITFQETDAGANVSVTWGDVLRDGVEQGGVAKIRRNASLDTLVGTRGRRNPVTGNTYNLPISDAAQIWALARHLNVPPPDGAVDTIFVSVGYLLGANNRNVRLLTHHADTVSHELAHTYGVNEGYLPGARGIGGGTAQIDVRTSNAFPRGDIMNAQSSLDPDKIFEAPLPALLRIVMGLPPIGPREDFAALTYYRDHANLNNEHPNRDGLEIHVPDLTTPELVVSVDDVTYYGDEFVGPGSNVLTFGSIAADGAAGIHADKTLQLVNTGVLPLVIDDLHLATSSAFTLIDPPAAGTALAPGDHLDLDVRFNPSADGNAEDTLIVESNAGLMPHFQLELQGSGLRVAPAANVTFANNNLGGARVDATAVERADIYTLTNDGLQPLVVSTASLIEGSNSFSLVGLPATPITLAAGEHVSFGASFRSDRLGLQRGVIDLVTNDPNRPHVRLGLVGTGVAAEQRVQWGNDYFALENPELISAPPLRGVGDNDGNFGFFLNAQTPYHIVGFDPATGLATHSFGTTAIGGQGTDLTATMVFAASIAKDGDFDGLADDIEFAIGTSTNKKDSDADGVDDFTEIQQGSDPLGVLRIPVGVMAATALKGTAEAVTALGTIDGQATLTALVATGSEGLALVDVTQATRPRVLAELDLPGNNGDVAVDSTRKLAAVAGNEAGLHIVDVSNPARPTLRQTVQFGDPATHVAVSDGVAYVTSGRSVVALELSTGEIVNTLNLAPLGSSNLRDIAISGHTAFVIDSNSLFRSIDISNALLTAVSSRQLPASGGQLFVADGIAYVGAGAGSGGYMTVDVDDPAHLTLLSGTVNAALAGNGIALNGSGLVLAVGGVDFVNGGFRSLDIFNGSNPQQTNNLLTRIDLPQIPKDLVLAGGFAFVADGASGLQLVNYLAPDIEGVPPVVSIALSTTQVLEGRTVQIAPTITDDVQIRSVELLVNGRVISTDVTYPFDLFARAPTVASAGNQMTLQVRATDTGGNVALSNTINVEVSTDTTSPQLVASSVSEGVRLHFVKAINLSFDEPIDLDRLTPAAVSLARDGGTSDDVVIPTTLDNRAFGQVISVQSGDFLTPGDYTLNIDAAQIADIAGNVLAENIVRHFTILPDIGMRATSGTPAANNAPSANPGQEIGIAVPFDPSTMRASFNVMDTSGNASLQTVDVFRWDFARGIAYFVVPITAISGDTVFFSQVGGVITNFPDGTLPLQVLPTISDVDVESVAADGSSAIVVINGFGFVEGNNSEYRFGSSTLVDTSTTSGPDVTTFNTPNGRVRITLPLSDGAFGAVSVKTAGGTSASFSVDLNLVDAIAVSGTPANPAQPSANAGQVLTMSGAGLSKNTDVLMRFTNSSGASGTATVAVVNPSLAAVDGRRAQLTLPGAANGVISLQVLGSTSQPRVQIVPTLTSVDIQSNTTLLFGSGLIEGASTYNFIGATVTDSAADSGNTIDVNTDNIFDNHAVGINRTALPTHGVGNVTVSTAGGTSTPFALNTVRVAVTSNPGDVAFDPTSGNLWVSDQASPTHLLRIDASTGQVLQTITITSAFGSTNLFQSAGLQVVSAPMTLGTTNVPAGSLLVFNGNIGGPDRVTAVNTSNGAVIASLNLDARYSLTAGTFNPNNGHLYIADNSIASGRIVELNAVTGVQVGAFVPPFNMQFSAGLAIHPTTGNLWLGASNGNSLLQEYRINGPGSLTLLRSFDVAEQNLNGNEVTGLSFTPNGTLWAASAQSELYRIDVSGDGSAVTPATLSGVIAKAEFGVAANPVQPSAHAGQPIDLVGTRFGVGTRVLFNIRDNAGNTRLVSQNPISINETGTRLRVAVPDLATTGDVRVVNQAPRSIGMNTARDAIYRAVTFDFVANGPTATIRFSDAGLFGPLDLQNIPFWGIDNVVVRRGNELVFADDFESASAAPQWSDGAISTESLAGFGRFSGRFSAMAQQLNLDGLSAGQTYTLSFDLLIIDGWASTSTGPKFIDVGIDGSSRMHETFANDAGVDSVQTFGASTGIRLQIVPTLTHRIRGDQFTPPGLAGSGFMEGATTVRIGGVILRDVATNLAHLDVGGNRNDTINFPYPPGLDGPIRVTTEGGYAEIPTTNFGVQPFTALTSSFGAANANQPITLEGGGFALSALVQFQGSDDSGATGTITGTSNQLFSSRALGVVVPSLARTGSITTLGSNTSRPLKIVPTLRAIGGTVAAGNTILLEGTGLAANDLSIAIDGRAVGNFSVRTVTSTSSDSQQLVTLVVPAGVGPGVVTVSTSGGSATLSTGISDVPAATPLPAIDRDPDVGDTLATALDTALALNQSVSIRTGIGVVPGQPNVPKDVDMFAVDLNAGELLTLKFPSTGSASGNARFFAADGTPMLGPQSFNNGLTAPLSWVAPFSGRFYVGISGSGNINYDPNTAGSGTNAGSLSVYTLEVTRSAGVSLHLASITATATSGTPTHTGIPSANTGQTITISGAGLRADDKLLFTTNNGAFGNTDPFPGTFVVTPVVDLTNQTLTAVAPAFAATGSVRLVRDNRGVLLQIVPTLSGAVPRFNANSFTGGTLQFTGSGFGEDALSLFAGDVRLDDIDRGEGFDVVGGGNGLNLTVPSGWPAGAFRVSAVGGTSALFSVSFTGIDATCASGTPANTAQACANAGQTITLQGSGFNANTFVIFPTVDTSGTIGDLAVRVTSTSNGGTRAQINVPTNALTGPIRVIGSPAAVPLQIIPTVTDAQVQSVTSDGATAVVILSGTGFVESNGSEYRFGSNAIVDVGDAGPDVRNDGTVNITVPLRGNPFGAVTVKTAGGVSAPFTVNLASINSTASTGTPADPAKGSANAGQTITLVGAGLSTNTDVLLRFVDESGVRRMVLLNPASAVGDGTSATLVVPAFANGAFGLQVFGSASQPVLQVVPTITSADIAFNTVLFGSGLVEGAGTYNFSGNSATDTPADGSTNIDVLSDASIQNRRVNLTRVALSRHGLGNVTIGTAGGTSAPFALNTLRLNVTGPSLGDVTIDPVSGDLWVSDQANPTHLLRISSTTGDVLQTITVTSAFGSTGLGNNVGLQILSVPMTLGTTNVPSGSLLVFNGNLGTNDRVIAVDPVSGNVIASLTFGARYALTGGTFNPANGHIYVTETVGAGNRIVELSTTGTQLGAVTVPFSVVTNAGITIDPATGHLWLGALNGGAQLLEYRIDDTNAFTLLRTLNATSQNINQNEISGLSFAADGALWVASTQGEVYRIDTTQ